MLQDGLLRDEVLTVADAVTAVAIATGGTVPVSTTAAATTREHSSSMKTSVANAIATRAYWQGKKRRSCIGTAPDFYAIDHLPIYDQYTTTSIGF